MLSIQDKSKYDKIKYKYLYSISTSLWIWHRQTYLLSLRSPDHGARDAKYRIIEPPDLHLTYSRLYSKQHDMEVGISKYHRAE